jgi:hypothetical protein
MLNVDEIDTYREFQQCFMRAFFVQNFVLSQSLGREKLSTRLSYQKRVRKMSIK